jgi:hypothetical protein
LESAYYVGVIQREGGGARNVSSSILIHQLTWWENKGRGDVLSVCCPIIFVKYLLCEELRSR